MIRYPNWLCPVCLSGFERLAPCTCGVRPLVPGAPGESPAFIGHFRLLNNVPAPACLLDAVCDGNPRYPVEPAAAGWTACQRHSAHSVWLWQDNIDLLPPAGTVLDAGGLERLMPVLRALSFTNLLLLEVLGDGRHFQARSARQRARQEPPSLAVLIDRLKPFLTDYCPEVQAIALVDPEGLATAEDLARLRLAGPTLQISRTREMALQWLLTVHIGAPAQSKVRPLRAAHVGIADVGGGVGRHLLSWLHGATLKAAARAPEAALVPLPGVSFGLGQRVWAQPTTEGLAWGRMHQIRQGPPAPSDALPAWSGLIKRWWQPAQPFTVQLDHDADLPGSPVGTTGSAVLVGVGPSRRLGRWQLARLVERFWTGEVVPAALLEEPGADPLLLGWVKGAFPGASPYPHTQDSQATLQGGLRALRAALRRAGATVSV